VQDVLDKVEQPEIDRVVDRVPDSVMVMAQKMFVKKLLAFTLNLNPQSRRTKTL